MAEDVAASHQALIDNPLEAVTIMERFLCIPSVPVRQLYIDTYRGVGDIHGEENRYMQHIQNGWTWTYVRDISNVFNLLNSPYSVFKAIAPDHRYYALKTSVLQRLCRFSWLDHHQHELDNNIRDLCAGFTQSCLDLVRLMLLIGIDDNLDDNLMTRKTCLIIPHVHHWEALRRQCELSRQRLHVAESCAILLLGTGVHIDFVVKLGLLIRRIKTLSAALNGYLYPHSDLAFSGNIPLSRIMKQLLVDELCQELDQLQSISLSTISSLQTMCMRRLICRLCPLLRTTSMTVDILNALLGALKQCLPQHLYYSVPNIQFA